MITLAQSAPRGATEITVTTTDPIAVELMRTPISLLSGSLTLTAVRVNPIVIPGHYRVLFLEALTTPLSKGLIFTWQALPENS